ncbi:MAG: 3-dehydroquinate synthase [Cytophagales bacterium]|nr:3-dehydroquinate synthase [Cytophagales bacterium]
MPSGHVLIVEDLEQLLAELSKSNKFSNILVLVDENTVQHCIPLVSAAFRQFHLIQIKSGEEEKNIQTCLQIWHNMTEFKADRKSILINIGGGVIGDMGGFCAATYKRGISFYQVPTTLLSMVDASVGGKLGIDFEDYKNHIGVFRIPDSVLIHPGFLKTLDKRELRSGFAEIIKHCLIADGHRWMDIKGQAWEKLDMTDLIRHSVSIKSEVVASDPEEKGLRKILNFGHTLGHAVESFYLNLPGKRLLHGEAIAIGMICEAWLSFHKGYISLSDCESIKSYILNIYPKVLISKSDFPEILKLTAQDKKNEGDQLLFSLLESIGKANFNIPIQSEEMRLALEYYLD